MQPLVAAALHDHDAAHAMLPHAPRCCCGARSWRC
jgi:hypothetical protein